MVAGAPSRLRVEPLGERHERSTFACGVASLDRYLRLQAGQDIRRRVAACFVLVADDDPVPVGYYTLASTAIVLDELPAPLAKRLPRYPAVPATLLGRLAVDQRYRGQGHGELLLFDALARVLRSDIASFALVVDAKDADAAAFYSRYRFRALTKDGLRMFVPLSEIVDLLR